MMKKSNVFSNGINASFYMSTETLQPCEWKATFKIKSD